MHITVYKHTFAYNFWVFRTTWSPSVDSWRAGPHTFKVVSTCLTTSFSAFLSSQVSWTFKPDLLYFCKEHHLPSLLAQGRATQAASCNHVGSTEISTLFLPSPSFFFFFFIRKHSKFCSWDLFLFAPSQTPISVFPFSIRTWKKRCMIGNSGEGLSLSVLQRRVPM